MGDAQSKRNLEQDERLMARALELALRGQASVPDDSYGAATGVQLFRHHEDESIIPELSYQRPAGTDVWGVGVRYLRKTGRRTFLEIRGIKTWSSESRFEREGVFASHFIVF